MENLFLEYFYHDVSIDMIKFEFDETDNGNHKIIFMLTAADERDDDGNILIKKNTCIFNSVVHCSLSIMLNYVGELVILYADIDNNDKYMLECKKEYKSLLSNRDLSTLNCYIIWTNFGGIKIISDEDIQVQE